MNVNTRDAVPMHEEILNPREPSPGRVFDDGTRASPLWFELRPDDWWNGLDEEGARVALGRWADGYTKISLATLLRFYPNGELV